MKIAQPSVRVSRRTERASRGRHATVGNSAARVGRSCESPTAIDRRASFSRVVRTVQTAAFHSADCFRIIEPLMPLGKYFAPSLISCARLWTARCSRRLRLCAANLMSYLIGKQRLIIASFKDVPRGATPITPLVCVLVEGRHPSPPPLASSVCQVS